MTLIIDPSSISYSLIRTEMLNYVKNKPDGEAWKDFFNSSAGNVVIELLAGTSAFLTFNAVTSRRENYLNYAVNRSSVIGIADNISYNVSRGRNAHVNIVIISDTALTINKWDIVGFVDQYSIIAWQTMTIFPSIPTVLECVVGNLITNINQNLTSSNTNVFRFIANNVSNDVRLKYQKTTTDTVIDLDKQGAMGTSILELLDDKYVLVTNPYDSVDIYYLNNKPNVLNLGDEIKLISSGTLPLYINSLNQTLPLVQNKSYFVIPVSANLIKLAELEVNANNNIPIVLSPQSIPTLGLHLINSNYSFDVYDVMNNTFAVNGIYPKYRYDNGTILSLDYVELKNIVFNLVDIQLYHGTIDFSDSRTKILNAYIEPENIGSIKVNAPLFFETQFVVKGREDFRKILKRADPTFLDTNSRDISPAIVEVTYIKSDRTKLIKDSKISLQTKLNSFRPFGDAPSLIVDPVEVRYTLNINLTLFDTGVVFPVIRQEIQNVLTYEPIDNGIVKLREKKLGYLLDFYQLEHEIDHLINKDGQKYIKIARVSMTTVKWTYSSQYRRGDFIDVGISDTIFTTDYLSNPTYLTIPNHGFLTGQVVMLRTTNTLPLPLVAFTFYYVVRINSNTIQLRITSTSLTPITLTSNGVGTNSIYQDSSIYMFEAIRLVGKTTIPFTTNFSNNLTPFHINSINHGLQTGQVIKIKRTGSGKLPVPLSENNKYYVKYIDLNNIEVSLTPDLESESLAFSDNGSGNIGINNIISGFVFSTNYIVNSNIYIPGHGLVDDQPIELYSENILPNPLVEGNVYYIKVIDIDNIQLQLKQTDGSLAIVNITTDGNGTHTLHTAIGIGLSSIIQPSFNTATLGQEIIDNEIIWKARSKDLTQFQLDWNEYFMFTFSGINI